MSEIDRPLEPSHRSEHRDNLRIILDETLELETYEPSTTRIDVRRHLSASSEMPVWSPVQLIHQDEFARALDMHNARIEEEDESMTFGDSITLLIAIGVLLYLIYALLWPERF